GKDEVFQAYWAEKALARNEVFDALAVIEAEYGLPAGMLRPSDKLELLVEPVRTRNPLRWIYYQVWAGDREGELSLQLRRRMARHGTSGIWPKLETIDDFVRAWCGRKPDE